MNENTIVCPTNATTSYNVTEKYKFQSTKDIISFFESQGFMLANKKICKVRNRSKQGFQKHMLRFNHEALRIDDQNTLQVLVKNSHDGSSSLQINLGIYRLVCSNGMVIGREFVGYNLKHIGHNFYIKLEESLKELIVAAPKYKEMIIRMQNVNLTNDQKDEIIKKAVNLRLQSIENVDNVDVSRSFSPIRIEDNTNDLYTVLNLVQERVIRGGIKYTTKTVNENNVVEIKNHSTKKINSIDKDLELNKNLFDIVSSYLVA
ncbi:MAG TPA: DUF932 domain-containing protein [Patescibacteria group bacterium]|nr:MAG: hypothetical protein UR43_C0005G0002 [candidate division TM6 bacterium GW2011_GWF2_33_332]HLD91164.1 DUF932 domain-containing protein [Patescibacteria group bacterium]